MEFNRPITDFSEAELREYACEHVRFEITHFVRAAQAIRAAQSGLFPVNFAVEVFALHLRNLLDFFAPRNPRPTDAWAGHFFEGWEPPELNLYLREGRSMANKHIAHLTTDRTTDPNLKGWAIEPIVWGLKPIIERFTEGAQLVCDTFQESVRLILAELPPRLDWTEMPPGSWEASPG